MRRRVGRFHPFAAQTDVRRHVRRRACTQGRARRPVGLRSAPGSSRVLAHLRRVPRPSRLHSQDPAAGRALRHMQDPPSEKLAAALRARRRQPPFHPSRSAAERARGPHQAEAALPRPPAVLLAAAGRHPHGARRPLVQG